MKKTVIDADDPKIGVSFSEIRQYIDLFLLFTYRDFKVKYAQTFLGILWAFLKPVITLIILILVFQKAIKVNTGDIPYVLFVLSALPFWIFFSGVLSNSAGSLIAAQNMIKKIYFPRILLPFSKIALGIPDALITFFFLFIGLIYYQTLPDQKALFGLFLVFHLIILTVALGVWVSALSVKHRDLQHILPFIIQITFYFTPIAFPSSLISVEYEFLFNLNPLKGIIDAFRWSVFGGHFPSTAFLFSLTISFILFFTGLLFFKKVEKTIADII